MGEEGDMARRCVAELVCTFLLVFFGTGSVFVAVLTGATGGLFQVAIVWGVAIALAIHATGATSGAHMNPAMTIAEWVYRQFPARRVLPYLGAQLAGAVLGSAVLLALFSGYLARFEARNGLVRGQAGSERSAMVFGEYFPNPALAGTGREAAATVGVWQAMAAEGIGTALLLFFIFALTDPRNDGRPRGAVPPLFIGLAVTIIICIVAPLTQAGLNPARDFGPRLVACFAGWERIAIPGPRGGFFTVYILAPILGGLAGAGLYELLIGRALKRPAPSQQAAPTLEEEAVQTT